MATIDEPIARVKAILALAAMKAADPLTVATLIATLKEDDATLRDAAAFALAALGSRVCEAILPLLHASCSQEYEKFHINNHDINELYDYCVANCPSELANLLSCALRDNNPEVRRAALGLLGYPGLLPFVCVSDVVMACKDADPYVRYEAASVLGEFGDEASVAVSELINLIAIDRSELGVLNTRQTAIFALGKIGPSASAAIHALVDILVEEDPVLRLAAVWALARIDPNMDVGLNVLLDGLKSVQETDRRIALEVVTYRGVKNRVVIKSVIPLLEDEVPLIRNFARDVLRTIYPENVDVIG